MTAKAYYLPTSDQDRKVWLDNFRLKLATHAATVGVSPATVTSVTDDANMWNYILGEVATFTAEKEERVEYKNLLRGGNENNPMPAAPGLPPAVVAPPVVKAGIFTRISKLVQVIKNHPAYTDSIGTDLGIIGADQLHDPDTLKPLLTGAQLAEGVKVGWHKRFADSIDIYVDRGAGFIFLANDTHPPYIDTVEVTAGAGAVIWKYKAVYRIADAPVGQFSDPIEVTVREQ